MTRSPGAFKDMNSSSWQGLPCFPEAVIPLMQHPPWSPAAGPPGGISWCCGRRNTSVWWNLGGSSRMTPGLEHHWRTAGIRGKGTWRSVHCYTKMEKEQPDCTGWLDSPGSQRPRQGNSRAGCHKSTEPNARVSLPHPSETTALSPCVLAGDSTWLSGLFYEKPRGWVITCFNLLIWLQNDQEAYLINSKSKQR